MAAIDLIVLGILKKESLSAYDIQKLVEYRNISKWVKISTPSIYKKVIQLEKKNLVKSNIVKEGKMPEKAVYSLTEAGEREFERLMLEISTKPIHFFLDFNAVIVNLSSLSPEKQKVCLSDINSKVKELKSYIVENLAVKEINPDIPPEGIAVLKQQLVLAETIETWIASLKESLGELP
ncbi:MAG: PadR family transcriptional regulator [Eubacteriales bacterium]|nr:PadR family transcriptional regulator [Eubacteriales bacterium]